MAETCKWDFPGGKNCPIKGPNDPGIETFLSNPIPSLAREICQNSLDAKHPKNVKGGAAVRVVFRIFDMKVSDFPGLRAYGEAIDQSLDFWKAQENERAVEILGTAKRVLSAETMRCLRVSDFNTCGLVGVSRADDVKPTLWLGLVKSEGMSTKRGESVGSFGIGKFAALACSQLRTVFYATKTCEGETGSQGVARLMTYRKPNGEQTFGTGYYGCRDAMPTADLISLDRDYVRDRLGTDVFIPAIGKGKVKEEIVGSVLDGFLYAIWNNALIVEVIDETGSETLDADWLAEAYRKGAFPKKGMAQKYELLLRETSEWEVLDFGERGRVKLSLMARRGLDSRIAMIRQPGMLIFNRVFPSALSFTGILIDEGKLGEELRKFENPQHNGWFKNRGPEGSTLLDDVYAFCEKCIEKLFKATNGECIDSGLSDILPDATDEGETKTRDCLGVTIVSAIEKAVRKRTIRRLNAANGSKGKGTRKAGGKGRKTGEGELTKVHGKGTAKGVRYEVPHGMFRPIARDMAKGAYHFKVVPQKDAAKGAVDVSFIGEFQDYRASIVSAAMPDGKPLKVVGSEIRGLTFQKGQCVEFDVVINAHDYISMEIDCHGYK